MKHRWVLILATATLISGCGGSTDPGPGAAPAKSLKFTRQAIRDPAANNVEAIVFLLPDGWTADGRVQWMHDWSRLAFLQTRLVDPVNHITIDYLPIQNFIWFQAPPGMSAPIGGNYQGKMLMPPVGDPQQFVRQFWMPQVLPHLAQARLVNQTQVPKIAEEFLRGFGGPGQAFAHKLRYEYEQDGRTWEEDVHFALLFSGSPQMMSWYVNFAVSVRAPKGEIDKQAGVISTVLASRSSTPEFDATYQIVQRLFMQGQQQRMADTAAFGRALSQYREESAALQKQITADRMASADRMAAYRRETLGGIETYRDAKQGTLVEMPAGWKDYWVNEKGEYLLSDQAGYNPNMGSQRTWQRMEPQKK